MQGVIVLAGIGVGLSAICPSTLVLRLLMRPGRIVLDGRSIWAEMSRHKVELTMLMLVKKDWRSATVLDIKTMVDEEERERKQSTSEGL